MSRIRIGYKATDYAEIMRYPGDAGHLLTCAPTGSGKFRDVLASAVMDDAMTEMSCLIVDPKGQLAAVTGPHAARSGKRVIMLNPFRIWPDYIGADAEHFRNIKNVKNLCDFDGSYNPLQTLEPSSDAFVPDAEAIAQAIVYQEHEGEHWTDSARDLVAGLIMYAAAHGLAPEKNLAWVRSTICNRPRLFTIAQKFFGDNPALAVNDANEFIAQKLGRFGEPEAKANREIGSIISTAVTQTAFIGNSAISRNLESGSFLFRELRQRPTVLYLILPGRRLKTCSRWFRLIVGAALNELMDESKARGLSCLLLLDEFAQLGPMKAIEDAFGIARDYALVLWPILQNLTQLQRDYKENWETMCANAGALQFFRPQDNTTAEYISKRTADIFQGIPTKSISESLGRGDLSVSHGVDLKQKKYLEPWEVREIGLNEFLLFAAGVNGVHRGGRRAYWDAPELKGRYSPDPYHS